MGCLPWRGRCPTSRHIVVYDKNTWGPMVSWIDVIWTDVAREKIAAHGVREHEVEQVLMDPAEETTCRTTGLPLARGWTEAGRPLVVVYRWVDAVTVEPITAYEPERN